MRIRWTILIFVWVSWLTQSCGEETAGISGENSKEEPQFEIVDLTKIQLTRVFDDDWAQSESFILNSWAEISQLPKQQQTIANQLQEAFQPFGVEAVGTYAFGYRGVPPDSVEVRVFRFENSEKCSRWIRQKYQYSGWQDHYARLEKPYFALDSKQMRKRIVAIGPYWITAGHLQKNRIHIEALEEVARQLGLGL